MNRATLSDNAIEQWKTLRKQHEELQNFLMFTKSERVIEDESWWKKCLNKMHIEHEPKQK